jgi:hypothetical protein
MHASLLYSTLVLGLSTVGCARGPHVVQVVATDYALQAPDSVPVGATQFAFANRGRLPHEAPREVRDRTAA